jgi:hypothetical protein
MLSCFSSGRVGLIYQVQEEDKMKTKNKESIFGIKMHAQLQTIDGRHYEFQPEHLFCEKCWEEVDGGLSLASYYGSCRALAIQEAFGPKNDCSITVTLLDK